MCWLPPVSPVWTSIFHVWAFRDSFQLSQQWCEVLASNSTILLLNLKPDFKHPITISQTMWWWSFLLKPLIQNAVTLFLLKFCFVLKVFIPLKRSLCACFLLVCDHRFLNIRLVCAPPKKVWSCKVCRTIPRFYFNFHNSHNFIFNKSCLSAYYLALLQLWGDWRYPRAN